ncbi:hypothetical protein JMJ35_006173 [Cladonia borealis]|uniref:CFEM domain-containing protein n=1 Tax=Cladonia borealis TaxID=184061 RepID=A0AA39QYP6_9LECA|nr:hypothetical protein JMJ35_006173 [Cladonia borealis]
MKTFAIVFAAGLVAVAQAQEQCAAVAAQIPACAVTCISPAASKVGCGATDFACQCEPANNAAINSAALECVLSGCGPVTGLSVQASASAVCACAATAASVPASSTAAAPASTAAVATTSAAPVASSSAPIVASSAASATSASSSAPYPVTSSGAVTATATPASSGGVTATSIVPFTGSAVKVAISVGGALGALLAVIAAL